MRKKVSGAHLQVVQTLHEPGLITLDEMNEIKAKVYALQTFDEREEYLKGIIKQHSKSLVTNK